MCSSNLFEKLLKSEASKWAIPIPSWTLAIKSKQLTVESYSKLSYYFMQAFLGYNRVQTEDFKMQERQTRSFTTLHAFLHNSTGAQQSSVVSKAYKASDLNTELGSLRFNLPLQ